MRITGIESIVLRLPLERPITPPDTGRGGLDHIFMLVVQIRTDTAHAGLGFAWTIGGGGRALKVLVDDDIAPQLLSEDPLDHERLLAKVGCRLQGIGRRGLVAQAYSAVDVGLWDLKGKVAGLPLYKILGGARESTPIYASDVGWLWMTPAEIIEAAQPYLAQGMMGVKMKVGSPNPEDDADRVMQVREALGEEIWFAVDANQKYDYGTALSMGHFFEEEVGADWFEEPISCEDVAGHARLAERLEVPIAAGESLFGRDEFQNYLAQNALDVVQPDVTRVGGLTPFLKIATLSGQAQRPIAPHLLPEIGVHLACGLPEVRMVEYMPWLYPAFVKPPAIEKGQMKPPKEPGLGLEISPAALERYGLRNS